MSLPVELSPKSLPQLPANTNTMSVVSSPVNGSVFTQNQPIIVDMITSRGFLNPATMYFRYKKTVVGGAGGTEIGCPAYNSFISLQTLIDGNVVETINDYNLYCEDLINVKLNVAQKMGHANNLGYGSNAQDFSTPAVSVSVAALNAPTAATVTSVGVNGRLLTANDSASLSAPFVCALSQCESHVPMFLMGSVRFILTVDSIANMYNDVAPNNNAPTAFSISNFELCYDLTIFDPAVEAYYKSLAVNGKIVLKSSSVASSTQPLATGSSGRFSFPFSFRLASVKSLLLHCSPATGTSSTSNGKHDSIDITSSNGSYQFDIAGALYPPRELSTIQNKNGIISELCLSLFGNKNILSCDLGINPVSWNRTSAAAGSTYDKPSTFYVGVNTEKCVSSSSMLTGVSTALAPIMATVNLNAATSQATTIRLFAMHDSLIQFDLMTGRVDLLN
jgi:hypothetical protein